MNYYKLGEDFQNETILNIAPKINRLAENKQYKALRSYLRMCLEEVDNLIKENYNTEEGGRVEELNNYKMMIDEQVYALEFLIEMDKSRKRKRKH